MICQTKKTQKYPKKMKTCEHTDESFSLNESCISSRPTQSAVEVCLNKIEELKSIFYETIDEQSQLLKRKEALNDELNSMKHFIDGIFHKKEDFPKPGSIMHLNNFKDGGSIISEASVVSRQDVGIIFRRRIQENIVNQKNNSKVGMKKKGKTKNRLTCLDTKTNTNQPQFCSIFHSPRESLNSAMIGDKIHRPRGSLEYPRGSIEKFWRDTKPRNKPYYESLRSSRRRSYLKQ